MIWPSMPSILRRVTRDGGEMFQYGVNNEQEKEQCRRVYLFSLVRYCLGLGA